MTDNNKLCVEDFEHLLSKTTDNRQIKAIVDCVDSCFQADKTILKDEDWPRLTVAVNKYRKD